MLQLPGAFAFDASSSKCLSLLGVFLLVLSGIPNLGTLPLAHAQTEGYDGPVGRETTATGAIGWRSPADGSDWYCARGTAGQEVTLTVTRTSGDIFPNLTVRAGVVRDSSQVSDLPLPTDGIQKSTTNPDDESATLRFTPSRNGPLSISVSTWTAEQDNGDYELIATGIEAPSSCAIGSGVAPPVSIRHDDEGTPLAPDTPETVEVVVPSPFQATGGTLYYRVAGTSSYQSTPLPSFSESSPQTAAVDLPASAVTSRGVQAYVDIELADSPTTATVPFEGPDRGPTKFGVASRTFFLPAQTDQVEVPGPFEPRTYRMLTVSTTGPNGSMFDAVKREYGPYNEKKWRFAHWAPEDAAYRFGSDVDSLHPGEAAWLIHADGLPLTVANARSVDAAAPTTITLQEGWNQIGSPYLFPVAWSSVQHPDAVRDPIPYDAERPEGDRFRFEDNVVLRPWRGAFVYVDPDEVNDGSVTLRVPPTEASSSADTASDRLATDTKASASSYRLQAITTLALEDRRLQDRKTWIGFADASTKGFGPEDLPKPPAMKPHVRLYAMPESGPGLAQSLRPLPPDGATWDLRLDIALDEQPRSTKAVTIQLAEQGTRPDGFRRYVIDQDRGTRLPITNQSVTVPVKPNESPRHLRVVVGTEAFAKEQSGGVPLDFAETALLSNAPNPFTESTTIAYQLAEQQSVTIAIYDLLGRRIQTLVDGERTSGAHEVKWHPGKEARGPALASGMYVCRMRTDSYTGSQKLVLVR